MPRLLSLLAAGVCCVCVLPIEVCAENKKAPTAGADWAKRAAGAKDSNAAPTDDRPATDEAENAGESQADAAARARDAETEPDTSGADANPSDKTGWTQRVMSPIFSQLVMISQPADFVVRFESVKGGSYIREAVPKGETVEDWSQMITVTGLQGASEGGQLTPQTFLENIAAGFQRACPQTFATAELKPLGVSGHPAYAAIASCGRVMSGPERSETAAILVIQGTKDFYTLQWAERGEASSAALTLDASVWQERLGKLTPVDLCDIAPGKKAGCR